MIFIGIDPGVSGAIAVLTTNTSPLISTWEVDDIPTVKVGKRREVDATKLYGMLSKVRRRSVPWFGARPGGQFNFFVRQGNWNHHRLLGRGWPLGAVSWEPWKRHQAGHTTGMEEGHA